MDDPASRVYQCRLWAVAVGGLLPVSVLVVVVSKLRKSARWAPHCMSCGKPNPNGDSLCLAHSNRLQDGKGMGLKSKDEAGAICCDGCHSLIDGRTKAGMDRLQRQDMHEQANRRTTAWWRKEGFL